MENVSGDRRSAAAIDRQRIGSPSKSNVDISFLFLEFPHLSCAKRGTHRLRFSHGGMGDHDEDKVG